MTSKMAQQQIEVWWSEGLKPTFKDIVLLNDLGLAVERGPEMFAFSACPRLAFLGDNIIREPTVAKRVWLDEAQRLFADTLETKLYLLSYALATPDDELPSLCDLKKIKEGVVKFRDEVLMKFTDTQIVAAIDYALNGNKAETELPENPTEEEKKAKDEIESVYAVPAEDHSMAKQILLSALAKKIPAEAANYALLEDLEHMIMVAAIHEGADVVKNEHTKAAARFYMASGRIHERLMEEAKK